MTDQEKAFQITVLKFYRRNKRGLPWRKPQKNGAFDPYHVLVSEVMLQQTQVNRVINKYGGFFSTFPSLEVLALADLRDVLSAWSGLGYNRRAKYLHQLAKITMNDNHGKLPENVENLKSLPGIGQNTAAAIVVYTWNKPEVFIETNIRTVFIHHFFQNKDNVSDTEILHKVSETLDKENPRDWYWALMDYGTYLKKKHGNNISKSRHYTKQSKFEGSRRQLRANVLKNAYRGSSFKKRTSGRV